MKHARVDRFHPVITVQNESTVATDAEVRRALSALQKQIDEDFEPAWGLNARLVFNRDLPRAMKVVIKDVSDEAGDLGYHFSNGFPVTYVFAKDDIESFGEFTSTLSHELLEMLADPDANLYADGFYRVKHGVHRKAMVAYEVCDAVEDYLYEIDGVRVSDFLFPEWFEPEHKGRALTMDFLGIVRRPFELAPGGYTDIVVGNRLMTIWNRKVGRDRVRHRRAVREANLKRAV